MLINAFVVVVDVAGLETEIIHDLYLFLIKGTEYFLNSIPIRFNRIRIIHLSIPFIINRIHNLTESFV